MMDGWEDGQTKGGVDIWPDGWKVGWIDGEKVMEGCVGGWLIRQMASWMDGLSFMSSNIPYAVSDSQTPL